MYKEDTLTYLSSLYRLENPTFAQIRDLTQKHIDNLPQDVVAEFCNPNNQVLLNNVFEDKDIQDFFNQPIINIIDYGCGLAISTLCYIDYLHTKYNWQIIQSVTLIEQSSVCLKRAEINTSVMLPDAEINLVNKSLDQLSEDDVKCSQDIPTLHLFSNVFDSNCNFDLKKFIDYIQKQINGYNQFVCISPYLNKDNQLIAFADAISGNQSISKRCQKYHLKAENKWFRKIIFNKEIESNEFDESSEVVYSSDGTKLIRFKNSQLKLYEIREGTKVICDDAFNFHFSDFDLDYPNRLEEVKIPNSVTTIGRNAFKNCIFLTRIVIPDSVTIIGSNAFDNCTSLREIIISKALTTINDNAFINCKSLQTVAIPAFVTTIGKRAFWNCSSIRQISFPKCLLAVKDSAFAFCNNLDSIFFNDCLSLISIGDNAFFGCTSLHNIDIPNSVISIGHYAFAYCKKLQQVVIPNPKVIINRNSFIHCDLLNPLINQNVEKILIKKVVINNFRAFKREEIFFDDFNCIIGRNDTGKSTIFAALDWFFDRDKELYESDFNMECLPNGKVGSKTYDKLCISVEVYFNRHNITDSSFIFNKDFLNKDGYLCIKKFMYHPLSKEVRQRMGYSIKIYPFNRSNKIFSDYSLDELKKEISLNDNVDNIMSKLEFLKNEEEYEGNEIKKQWYHFKILSIQQKIYGSLYYKFSSKNKEINNQWLEFDNRRSQPFHLDWFETFKVYIFTPNTPLKYYLNSLLQIRYRNQIENIKASLADDLSSDLSDRYNISEKIEFKSDEIVDLFSENSLLFKNSKHSINVPIYNRGEGFQVQIKNAVFRLLAEKQSSATDHIIFIFEEPETHLHPSAQKEFYEIINNLSKNSNYQVFLATHSPYIVKKLENDQIKPIVVKRQEGYNESKTRTIDERVLPYVSMNEMNYIAFDEPSIEYHIELFGYIHNKLIYKFENDNNFATNWELTMTQPNRNGGQDIVGVTYIKGVDLWFEKSCGARKYRWFETKNYKEERRTLPYCVRNNIDHPLKTDDTSKTNGHKAFVNNNKYFKPWIIKESIELMRHAIINNPDIFNDN
ncbi:MAG: leucine-rich repeat protein [Bacteroidales bacterium]|nr:leucine-rich repeat protein [Bacteroidales bacterium]